MDWKRPMLIKYDRESFPTNNEQFLTFLVAILFLFSNSVAGDCSEATATYSPSFFKTSPREVIYCKQNSILLALIELNRILAEKASIKRLTASLSDDYKIVQIQVCCLTSPPNDSKRHHSFHIQTICKMLQESKSFGEFKLIDAKRVRCQNPLFFGWEFQLHLNFYVEKKN